MANNSKQSLIRTKNSPKHPQFWVFFFAFSSQLEWVMRCKLFRKRRESSSKLVNSIEQLFAAVYIMNRVVTRLLFSISIGARWFSSGLPRSDSKTQSTTQFNRGHGLNLFLKHTGSHKAIF